MNNNNNIYVPKQNGVNSSICTKIIFMGLEISISCDDSCGGMKDFSRVEIKVFDKDDNDVTEKYLKDGTFTSFGINSTELFEIMCRIKIEYDKENKGKSVLRVF